MKEFKGYSRSTNQSKMMRAFHRAGATVMLQRFHTDGTFSVFYIGNEPVWGDQ